MSKKQLWRYVVIVLVISLFLGILIHFSTILEQFGVATHSAAERGGKHGAFNTIIEILISSVVAFFTFVINYFIIRPLDGSVKQDLKRISAAVVLTLVSVTILSDAFFALKNYINARTVERTFSLLYTFRDVFTGIVVLLGIFYIKSINDRQTVRIENEVLKRENLVSQYESLKNQVSPHFLFNSLTALRELVVQDPGKAQMYINHLSQVLRYTLRSNQSRTCSLAEEVEVAESYLFLLKMRFGPNLIVEKSIDERYSAFRLPPLAIQTLLENAIKHNEISKKYPLKITIETTSQSSLRIVNTLREKNSYESSTGLGLSNLSKQYSFLSGRDILISKSSEFAVEIPLLNPLADENTDS